MALLRALFCAVGRQCLLQCVGMRDETVLRREPTGGGGPWLLGTKVELFILLRPLSAQS